VEVTGIEPSAGDTANLQATFSIKGVTAPVSLPVQVSALGGGAVRVTAKTQIDRYQFGIDWNQLGMVAKTATVTAEAYFVRTPQ
jgi:polyisoprenoid-binding protein YceI